MTQFCFYVYDCTKSIQTGKVRAHEPAIYYYEPFPQKFIIYSIRGELVTIGSTKKFEDNNGEPVAVSPSGKMMLFKNKTKSRFAYTIGQFTFSGFQAVKSFNLIQVLENLLLQ